MFSLDDRLGLVNDAMALSRAGLAKLSSALTLIDLWREEKECMSSALSSCDEIAKAINFLKDLVWQGIADSLSNLVSIWWEHPKIIDKLNAFHRVRHASIEHSLCCTHGMYSLCLFP